MNLLNLMMLLLLACSKGSQAPAAPARPVTPPSQPVETAPDQYGTPFNKVPDAANAVIYQVNMRAFSATGDLKGVQQRLDSIKALGVNVVYLLPVYPVGVLKSVNSPYCIKDFNSVAPEFGTLADLRALVDGAHQRGMAVILDWVADHTAWDHPWTTAHKDWYQQDGGGNIIAPPGTGWNDVAALDYKSTALRKAMIKAMQSWIYTANVDGYRCDAADFVPYDFWVQALDSLQKITTHKLLLYAEGTRKDQFQAGFQLEYGMGFYYTLKDKVFGAGASVKLIDSVNNVEYSGALPLSQVVRYTSNHDVNNSDGTPLELFGGRQGSLAVFTVAALMKSVPMLYNGQEIGCAQRLTYFNNSTPIDWTPVPDITAAYKAILAFRSGSDAVKTGALASYSSDDVCVFTKTAGGKQVLVMANLRNKTVTYNLPAAIAPTGWRNAFDGSAATLATAVALQPYEYRVLRND